MIYLHVVPDLVEDDECWYPTPGWLEAQSKRAEAYLRSIPPEQRSQVTRMLIGMEE